MDNEIHVFTSITSNYLPKARVLADSVKRTAPGASFHLVLCDSLPVGFELAKEPFDDVIQAEDLIQEDFFRWAFGHSVVEMCTAVKGPALEYIFARFDAQQVFYFDPDMVVFSRLDELSRILADHSLILTPHLTDPDPTDMGIEDSEMASLRHGVFNLGFIGVRNVEEGRKFSRWWAQRLLKYCHDDMPRGLFTDQKWVNLAPCFYEGVGILRSPAFNVATWNLATRRATGSLREGIKINGEPLGFYHFSGFDSGDQQTMLERYGEGSPVLYELREWYVGECERLGQSALGGLVSRYDSFSSGERIERPHRLLYRQRIDLQRAFPNPYVVQGHDCYKAWYDAHPSEHLPSGAVKIADHVPVAEVLADLSRHFNSVLMRGQGRGPFKRMLLKLWIRFLSLTAAIAR